MTTITHPTAIKFCGFTQVDDIQAAVALGVDAVGLVFYPPSPRAVTPEQACALAKAVPAFTTVVALVVNMPEHELVALAAQVPFDVLQFHGDESAAQCQQLAGRVNKRWIKALRVSEDDTSDSLLAHIAALSEAGASAVLLDAYHPNKFGGTGERFDWDKMPTASPLPLILAGGLTPDNVADALCQANVYGVDVSGGIEAIKGIKDAQKMTQFVQCVRRN